jgi:transcriptional regulator with XRE-family HTH domain
MIVKVDIILDNFYNKDIMCSVKQTMTREEVVEFMREQQGDRMSKEYAAELGIHESYLSNIYRGKADPGESVLYALGLRKLVLYTKAA